MNTGEGTPACGAWNPGIQSQVPREVRHLATIFRPENVFRSFAEVTEMQGLTGLSPSELVAFRPERLALHELLIRITADFEVPDGSRIGDLGTKFREMAGTLLARYVVPEMDAITVAYERTRLELRAAIDAALREVVPEQAPPGTRPGRPPAPGLFALFTAAAESQARFRWIAVGVRATSPIVSGSPSLPNIPGRAWYTARSHE